MTHAEWQWLSVPVVWSAVVTRVPGDVVYVEVAAASAVVASIVGNVFGTAATSTWAWVDGCVTAALVATGVSCYDAGQDAATMATLAFVSLATLAEGMPAWMRALGRSVVLYWTTCLLVPSEVDRWTMTSVYVAYLAHVLCLRGAAMCVWATRGETIAPALAHAHAHADAHAHAHASTAEDTSGMLLAAAFTGRSCGRDGEEDNTRLAWMGHATLEYLVAAHLWETHPDADDELLSQLCFHLTAAELLADAFPAEGRALIVLKDGEELTASAVATAYKAVVGAHVIAHGMEAAAHFVQRTLLDALHRPRE